jgi:HSP20 family protein
MMMYYFSPSGRQAFRPRMGAFNAMQAAGEDCQCSFPADIRSTAERYEIRALIAGVPAEELDIQFTRNTVSIKGEYKPARAEGDDYLRTEMPEGQFNREISFSEPIKAEKAEATLKDGILTLFIPKAEEAKPRTIKVKAQ